MSMNIIENLIEMLGQTSESNLKNFFGLDYHMFQKLQILCQKLKNRMDTYNSTQDKEFNLDKPISIISSGSFSNLNDFYITTAKRKFASNTKNSHPTDERSIYSPEPSSLLSLHNSITPESQVNKKTIFQLKVPTKTPIKSHKDVTGKSDCELNLPPTGCDTNSNQFDDSDFPMWTADWGNINLQDHRNQVESISSKNMGSAFNKSTEVSEPFLISTQMNSNEKHGFATAFKTFQDVGRGEIFMYLFMVDLFKYPCLELRDLFFSIVLNI